MKKWPWLLYGIFLTVILFGSIENLFYSDSAFRNYYTILIAFNKRYLFSVTLNIINSLLNLLAPLIVFLYALDIKGSTKFWQTLFWARIFFDLVGNNYADQFIKASFHQTFLYGIVCIGAFTLPMLPSYLAHYLYAFKNPVTAKN